MTSPLHLIIYVCQNFSWKEAVLISSDICSTCPHTFSLGSSHVMWNTMMLSVKWLTEIPAMNTQTRQLDRKTSLIAGKAYKQSIYYHVALTFEEGVQHSPLDLGFLHHIGSSLGEDDLPWPRFKTVSIVFNHGNAVLHNHRIYHGELCWMWRCVSSRCRVTIYYLNVLIANHLENPHVYVLLA